MRVVLACAAFVLALPGAARAADPVLYGTVGPQFTIRLTDGAGKPVSHLDPGEYLLQVDDESPGHNFHLYGPGVDVATDVLGVGVTTWTVTLTDGFYAFVCDIHNGEMSGGFAVGSAVMPARVGTLLAAVDLNRVSLSPHAVRRGAYTLTVLDASRTANFHFRGPGVDRRTPVAGVATVTWRVTLEPGVYAFGSDSAPPLRGRLRVR
jgi:hypothetical protein